MFLEKTKDELANIFMNNLVSTNRGYNYYVDWSNIKGYDDFAIEINGYKTLSENQLVEFKLIETSKGYQAINVRLLKEKATA